MLDEIATKRKVIFRHFKTPIADLEPGDFFVTCNLSKSLVQHVEHTQEAVISHTAEHLFCVWNYPNLEYEEEWFASEGRLPVIKVSTGELQYAHGSKKVTKVEAFTEEMVKVLPFII